VAEAVDSVTNITMHSSLDNPLQSVNSFSLKYFPATSLAPSGFGIPRAFNLSARDRLGERDDHDHDGKTPKSATIGTTSLRWRCAGIRCHDGTLSETTHLGCRRDLFRGFVRSRPAN